MCFTFVLHSWDICSLAPHYSLNILLPIRIINKDWLLLSLWLNTFHSRFLVSFQRSQVSSESLALLPDSHRINGTSSRRTVSKNFISTPKILPSSHSADRSSVTLPPAQTVRDSFPSYGFPSEGACAAQGFPTPYLIVVIVTRGDEMPLPR